MKAYEDLIVKDIVEVHYLDRPDEFKLRMRAVPSWQLDRLRRKCRPMNATSPDDVDLKKWLETLADEVVVGWDLRDREGNDVRYSKGALMKLAADWRFAAWLTEKAGSMEHCLGESDSSDSNDSSES